MLCQSAAAQDATPPADGASPMRADVRGFSAQRLRPAADATGGFLVTQRGRTIGADALNASLAFQYARNPLVLSSTEGVEPGYGAANGKLVTSQSALHLLLAVGPTAWLELGVDFPFIVQQAGEPLAGLPDPNEIDGAAGLGDIRLVPRAMVIDTRTPATDYPVAVSVGVDATLPTGSPTRFQGGQAELLPLAALEVDSPEDVRLAGHIGYAYRPRQRAVLGVQADSAVAWSAGISVPAGKYLRLSAEVAENLSTEALFGATVTHGPLVATAVVGVGLTDDALTPDHRLLLRVGYVVSRSASLVWRDKDGDTVPDWQDECPGRKEDLDGFKDSDGCPDSVRDYIESMPK